VPLTQALGLSGMFWLATGGLLYTVGIVFYANDERWLHAHGIWHLFVLGRQCQSFHDGALLCLMPRPESYCTREALRNRS